jgi:hypothetical protein
MPLTVRTPLFGIAIRFNPVTKPVTATYAVPHSTIIVLDARLTSGFDVEQLVARHHVTLGVAPVTIPILAVNCVHDHLSANNTASCWDLKCHTV